MTDDQLTQRLDELCRTLLPDPIMQEWRAYEHSSKTQFAKEFGRFQNQFELYLGTIVELLYAINYVARPDWPNHRTLQYCLMVYNVKPLYSSVNRLSSGFVEDAITLLRPVFETIIRIVYISCFPEDPYAPLVHKPPKDIRQFQLNNFIEKDLGLTWLKDYAILSSFTHSNSLSVVERMMKHLEDEGTKPFDVLLEEDQGYKYVALNFTAFYLYCYLHMIRRVFDVNLEGVESNLWDKASELEMLCRESILRHPNKSKHFEHLITDFDQMVELIMRCDADEEWQKAWTAIRAKTNG